MGALLFSAFFGFLSAAILQKILRHLLRFRAEWTSTFIACMLTCLVSGAAFVCVGLCIDKNDDLATVKVLGTSFGFAFFTGLLAFRLIIKSESGRSLAWDTAAIASFALAVPPLVLMSLLTMAWADF